MYMYIYIYMYICIYVYMYIYIYIILFCIMYYGSLCPFCCFFLKMFLSNLRVLFREGDPTLHIVTTHNIIYCFVYTLHLYIIIYIYILYKTI